MHIEKMSLPALHLPVISPIPSRVPCLHSKPENAIVPCLLHPMVPATDGFLHWLTPFGINHMNCLAKAFPPLIIAHNHIILFCSVTQELLSNYSAGLLCFTRFCDDFNVNLRECQ